MTIDEILTSNIDNGSKIELLKEKAFDVPQWAILEKEYNPKKHPVMNKFQYPDVVPDDGVQRVTRITCDLQRLATKRMTELITGIPVKRIYSPKKDNQQQKDIAFYIENILQRARIDSVNNERCNMLYASCEVLTLWYAINQPNKIYGFDSQIKLKCANYSPMNGDKLFPLFDEFGDLIAMSVGYQRKNGRQTIEYFDTYTATRHIKWMTENDEWREVTNEPITLGKIPAIYCWRPTPIWEDTSKTVYEIEWALSRNGNYLRENSKPLFVVFSDEQIQYGDEKSADREFRSVMQYPAGSSANYITWSQAVDNLKFYVEQLRSMFFTQLQLPDWSYDKMASKR